MLVTPMDIAVVMFLSTLAGMLLCEACHLLEVYKDEDKTI
jgi:formate-dependent nitrite reductase membrane component NrfD